MLEQVANTGDRGSIRLVTRRPERAVAMIFLRTGYRNYRGGTSSRSGLPAAFRERHPSRGRVSRVSSLAGHLVVACQVVGCPRVVRNAEGDGGLWALRVRIELFFQNDRQKFFGAIILRVDVAVSLPPRRLYA